MKGILARKIGMTRMINPETGKVTPVTLLEAPANSVLQIKTAEKDGYSAVVLGAFERKHFGKNPNQEYKFVQELRLSGEEMKDGDKLTVASLEGVKDIRITGVSKGRGFAGVIKRHKFSRGPETHGSNHHREPGSSGTRAKPGRIKKGKRFPGHMGIDTITMPSEIMQLDLENNLIAVRGGVPGAKNSFVFVSEKK